MMITWDEPKRATNLRTHGLDFADIESGFEWDTAVVAPSHPGRDGRTRFLMLGYLHGKLRALVFSPLGNEAIAVISLRPVSRKERKSYAEA